MASAEQLKFELLAVDRASRPIQQVQNRVKSFDRQVKRTSVQMNSFGGAFTGVTKDLRKFSLGGLQQAGYQIGDYAVQVANGTSKMQAFGQQAGQFFQIFGPFGAVLGAAISVFSAFSLAASRASGEAKSAAHAIDSLKTAISTYRDATEKALMPSDELIAKFGKFGSDIRQNLELLRAFKADDAMDMVKMTVNSLNTEFEGLVGEVEMFKSLLEGVEEGSTDFDIISGAVEDLAGKLGITGNQVGVLSAALKNIQNASTLDEVVTAGNNFRTLLMMIYKNTTDIPPEMRDIVSQIVRANIAAADLSATQNDVKGAVSETNKFLEDEDALMSMIVDKSTTHEAILKRINEDKDAYLKKLSDEDIVMGQIVEKAVVIGKSGVQGGRGADPRQFTFLDEYLAQIAAGRKAKDEADEAAQSGTKKTAKIIKSELSPELMRIKDASEMIGSSFENAFMSVREGTMSVKDAFNSMANDIINELYRIFVVKQITGFISSAFTGAFNPASAAGTGGSVAPPRAPRRAMGGPVSGGRAYMVGERGPELVVPSRNGHVMPNNQLGGGTVVVNQNINVATGVQQTVRAEVLGLMPQIAEASKAAVLDARRRGGAFAGSF